MSLAENATRMGACSPVTLLYIRAEEEIPTTLDRCVEMIALRYEPWVQLRCLSPDEAGQLARGTRTPCLLVLRNGHVVGEAAGSHLPAREIDRVVRCAVEWAS